MGTVHVWFTMCTYLNLCLLVFVLLSLLFVIDFIFFHFILFHRPKLAILLLYYE